MSLIYDALDLGERRLREAADYIEKLEAQVAALTAENAGLRRDTAAEIEGALSLRRECGAKDDETLPDFVRRLTAENAKLRAEVKALSFEEGALKRDADALRLDLARVTEERDDLKEWKVLHAEFDVAAECGRLREEAREAGVKLYALGRKVVGLEDQRDALRRAADAVEPIDGEDPRDGLVIVERRRLDALRAAVAACKEPTR